VKKVFMIGNRKFGGNYLTRRLPPVLPEFLQKQRWFGGKARKIISAPIVDIVLLADQKEWAAFFVVARVEYADGAAESYAMPLELTSSERMKRLHSVNPSIPALRLRDDGDERAVNLCDALWDPEFTLFLLKAIPRHAKLSGLEGEIEAVPTHAFEHLAGRIEEGGGLKPSLLNREQSNTSVVFGNRLIMKFFRRLEENINPDVELGTFLTERGSFGHSPLIAGNIFYRRHQGQRTSAALVQAFVQNQGDAWRYTLSALDEFFRKNSDAGRKAPELPRASLLSLARTRLSSDAQSLIGDYLDSARLLGQRTAELHIALASDSTDSDFAPEPFSLQHQRDVHEGMVEQAERSFQLLGDRLDYLPPADRDLAAKVQSLESAVRGRFDKILGHKLEALRTRVHGDYHLGQVLCTDGDFVIIDFEGEPARPISERRSKMSPLKDVAGMLRSFHYAAESALLGNARGSLPAARPALEPWAHYWRAYISAAYLGKYLEVVDRATLAPKSREDLEILLQAYLLEKAAYELGYELNNRPNWVRIPLEGILQIVEERE
jgi:maltose alpha-D-glucosyltransferase / alpha-amylase